MIEYGAVASAPKLRNLVGAMVEVPPSRSRRSDPMGSMNVKIAMLVAPSTDWVGWVAQPTVSSLRSGAFTTLKGTKHVHAKKTARYDRTGSWLLGDAALRRLHDVSHR